MTNEFQDLLADLNASCSDALEALQKGDLDRCGHWLKVAIDEIRENMDGEDEEAG